MWRKGGGEEVKSCRVLGRAREGMKGDECTTVNHSYNALTHTHIITHHTRIHHPITTVLTPALYLTTHTHSHTHMHTHDCK